MNLNEERAKRQLSPVLFHTDAAQAIGKIPVDVIHLKVDFLTIVGHKVCTRMPKKQYTTRLVYCTLTFHTLSFTGQESGPSSAEMESHSTQCFSAAAKSSEGARERRILP